MAIDDNTSYELTGAQVKDLASKINAKADTTDLPSVMTGATSSTAGTSGLVPAPAAGDEAKVLSGAGTWVNQSGGGGSSSVTYYATSGSTQGFPTYYTYLYSDSARTTVVTPDTILNNFENGDTILIEYESTQTGSSAYKMTLSVETVAKVGAASYRMNASEINIAAGNYNQVETQFSTTWDGQSSFNGRWVLVRNTIPTVNDGTLTIQQNGTTVGTFTANQSGNTTVNLAGGIYADDPTAPVNPNAWITPSDVDWSAFTDGSTYFTIGSLLIQFGTEDFGNQSYSSGFWGSTNRSANQNLHVTFPKAFSAKPYYVGIQPVGNNQMAIAYAAGSKDDSATRSRDFAVLVPSSQTGTLSTKVQWIAIGPA